MNKATSLFKPMMPVLSAVYGMAIIYVTALPLAGDSHGFAGELLTWLITLARKRPLSSCPTQRCSSHVCF